MEKIFFQAEQTQFPQLLLVHLFLLLPIHPGGLTTLTPFSESISTGLTPVCPFISCTGEPKTRTRFSRWVSQVLTRRDRSLYLDTLAEFVLMQLKRMLASFITRHIAGSWSTSCLPGPPVALLQSCFPGGQPPAGIGAWGYFVPGAELCFCLC